MVYFQFDFSLYMHLYMDDAIYIYIGLTMTSLKYKYSSAFSGDISDILSITKAFENFGWVNRILEHMFCDWNWMWNYYNLAAFKRFVHGCWNEKNPLPLMDAEPDFFLNNLVCVIYSKFENFVKLEFLLSCTNEIFEMIY